MKVFLHIILVLVLSAVLCGQKLEHESNVINIEVPVRVFQGETFVEGLTIEDFEVFEDGRPQKVEAVYLIKKIGITREEGTRRFEPVVSRNFVLLFEISEYLPRVGEAIDYFFQNVLLPGDTLTVLTPMKTYVFRAAALERLPREKIGAQLKAKLNLDVQMGYADYRGALRDLLSVWQSAETGLDVKMASYQQFLDKLEVLRHVDPQRLRGFAEFLKAMKGQKVVFLFYQKEVVPQPDWGSLGTLMSLSLDDMDTVFNMLGLFDFDKRATTFDVDQVKRLFSDSSVSVHFLYITESRNPDLNVESMRSTGMQLVDRSEDIFSTFEEVARATGGLTTSSANAASAFRKAVAASENYYLIYYSPRDYRPDGKFRSILVRLKKKNYRLSHRSGYFASY